jgi:tetratricopeptide (TPR) repeat protein
MKKLVFLGNCQARRLEVLYNEKFSPITGDTTEFVASFEPFTQRVSQIMADADVLVAQAIDSEHEINLSKIETKAQIIEFPNVTGMFLWPFSGQPHVSNTPLPHMPDGPYGMQLGNRWLDNKIKAGAKPDDIVNEYESFDVAKVINLTRMYELVMDRAHQRDQRTGFSIAPIIEKNLTEIPLFMTPANLELALFRPLAFGVYQQLGISSTAVDSMLETLWRTPFPVADQPIHPSIARHFGLKFIGGNARYRTYAGERLLFREWISRYVRYEWNDALAQGTYNASRLHRYDADAQTALDQIDTGISQGSGSVFGETCRSHLLTLKGDRAGAIAASRRAAQMDPTNPQIVGTLSVLVAEQGDLEEAEVLARRITHDWPNYADGWARLGIMLARRGKINEAIVSVTTAVQMDPRNPTLRIHLASLLKSAGQPERARDMLTEAIAVMPERADLYEELSRLAAQLDDLDTALIAARRAVYLDPQNGSRHAHLANTLIRRSDYVSAGVVLREAISLAPEQASLSVEFAKLMMQLGRQDEALSECRRAIALEPANMQVRRLLAEGLTKQGAFLEAESIFTEALSINPENADLHVGLISASLRGERYEEAEASARRAVQLLPNHGHLHHLLAEVLYSRGKLAAAEQSYRTAVYLAPNLADWRGSLALLLGRLGRLDEGLRIIDEAISQSPANPHLLAKKSYLLAENGDLTGARTAAETALSIAPQLAGLYGVLADVCEREGNHSAALSTYRSAITLDAKNSHYQRQIERLSKLEQLSQHEQAAE